MTGERCRRVACLVLAWLVLALALPQPAEAAAACPAAAWVCSVTSAPQRAEEQRSARPHRASAAQGRPSFRVEAADGVPRGVPEREPCPRLARLAFALGHGERLYLTYRALLC